MSDEQMNLASISARELFEEWARTEISFFDELGREQMTTYGEELVTQHNDFIVIDLCLDGRDDPADQMRAAEEELESALKSLQLARKSFSAWQEERIIMPEEPDDRNYELHLAWQRAANAAEANPRYLPTTPQPSEEATFLEDGRKPAPLSEPEFVEMTPEDQANIQSE
ncbi:hypothetical protein [Agrobacterium sp. CG674]